jgi:hypothetical protein
MSCVQAINVLHDFAVAGSALFSEVLDCAREIDPAYVAHDPLGMAKGPRSGAVAHPFGIRAVEVADEDRVG